MEPKILKADALPRKVSIPSPKILKGEVYEAGRDAREIVERARDEAKQIIEAAERQKESIAEQARQDGIAQGLAQWNEVLARTAERAEALANSWEETMLRLSVKAAEKIIGEELRAHPDAIVAIVRQVLQGTRCGRHITIQVNEADAQEARDRIDSLKQMGAITEITIVGSSSVARGGCVVQSELGVIDARLETQLKCLEDILLRGISQS